LLRERIRVSETADGLNIETDARPGRAFRLGALAWLLIWAVLEWVLIQRYHVARGVDPDPFVFVWLGFWSAGGAISALAVTARLAKRELLRLDETHIHHYRHFGWFRRSSHFERSHIEDLRAVPEPEYDPLRQDPATFWGFADCGIEFRYGHVTVRIAVHLDRTTSVLLVERVRAWLAESAGPHPS
jgi:hypothetical protein